MNSISQPEVWRDLYVMIGTAAATLVGLLFVVMSLYFNSIRDQTDYAMAATVHAARNNTYHLLTVMVTAIAVLTPQPMRLLGGELAILHLFGLRLPILFTYAHFIENRGGFPFSMIVTISAGYVLGAAGGAALIGRAEWGLYLVTASCILLLVRSVLTAWMLMFGRHRSPA
ncbi:MAG TPA: hypothetical protein VG166_11230 [Caulobacteraceae bacterium]|jgi:hypothetical protein|nr:hypothetical protein [Caulobacteraceae bacterium]